jgi:hypothetical protein
MSSLLKNNISAIRIKDSCYFVLINSFELVNSDYLLAKAILNNVRAHE